MESGRKKERLQCFTSLRLRLVSFSPVFTGAERIADAGLTFFCFWPVKECEVPEHNISSDRAACVPFRSSHVGHLAKIKCLFEGLERKKCFISENLTFLVQVMIKEIQIMALKQG